MSAQTPEPTSSLEAVYRPIARSIIQAALSDSFAYDRMAYLCDSFGPRFSGSPALEEALDWIIAEMRRDGLEGVGSEDVLVPRWIRGDEHLEMLAPRTRSMAMLGLGGSVGTPLEGIEAEVLVVRSFDELAARTVEADGKIVVYNAPFATYGETVRYRTRGAVAAARAGAVASLIRSVGPISLQTPHTGSMHYAENERRIPHAAITIEDAEMLERLLSRGTPVRLRLTMGAHQLPDTLSRNVFAEIRGSERPDEVVVVGGHIDSWDVGTGAVDDAGGSVAAWEVVRLLHKLGLRPRRTIRVVLWTNEENGLRGGRTYRDNLGKEVDNHVLAIESDSGVFSPTGFTFSGSEDALAMLQPVGNLLDSIGADRVVAGGGGADIGPLMDLGTPGMGLAVDGSRYFWYHHTNADTPDKLDPGEMNRYIAAMAVMAYVVADMESRLPRVIGVEEATTGR